MKKLTFLALSLFACFQVSASITFDALLKTETSEEIVLSPISLSLDNNTAKYTINDVDYKVVLMNYVKNEDGTVNVTIEISSITNDIETLLVSPTLTLVNNVATTTIGSDENYVKISIQDTIE